MPVKAILSPVATWSLLAPLTSWERSKPVIVSCPLTGSSMKVSLPAPPAMVSWPSMGM